MLQTFPPVSSQAPSFFLSWRSTLASGQVGALPIPGVSARSAHNRRRPRAGRIISCASLGVKTAVEAASKTPITVVKAVVTVNRTTGGAFAGIGLDGILDGILDVIGDLIGKSLLLELVSSELDQKTGSEKDTISAFAHRTSNDKLEIKYEASFTVPKDFGEIGGVFVTNELHKETWVKNIVLTTGDATSGVDIPCRSWVHAMSDSPEKRFFFAGKSYLPSQTPSGLVRLREKELQTIRGDGTGERKPFERIYDYDTYNDLGDPDKSDGLARPVLGGTTKYPYPRRCRTGRPRTKKEPETETRSSDVYVPRDEAFSEVKEVNFSSTTLRSGLRAAVQLIDAIIDAETEKGFPHFTEIDALFDKGVPLTSKQRGRGLLSILPRLVKAIKDTAEEVMLFDPPAMFDRDKFSWLKDEEFSRQTLAGLNPFSIELVREFPLKSKLDPAIYGPPESAITEQHVEREIRGIMTLEEALEQKRLFVLDYHDLLLPYVHKIRELEGTTLYGSRTVFFRTHLDTLMPIAIELTRPASPTEPHWSRVFLPGWDTTEAWLWKLAKAHVCCHDTGYHQLVVHWLRTHCCTEAYIIAANRQLSAAHPIYKLLDPYFRYTMEINAQSREQLISGNGIIETCFSPGKYSMELSSVAYGDRWRFDMESLPGDLIRRGMAVEDPTAEHGVRLVIEDYPFAADGLLIWSSIEQWVTDYVSHYYPDSNCITGDSELQAWWTEVRTQGHADKRDEPWWPKLDSRANLVRVLCTIIWVASGHHAAVNFGQYHYGGYFPNRPTTMRRNIPAEDEKCPDFARFIERPESVLLESLPSQRQATIVMAVLDILSTHSPDEEYLGGEMDPAWVADPVIRAAFERFNGRMKEIEGIINSRNVDPSLKNRCGAGIVPYELLKPFSKPGVTGMGVPNSISI